MVKCERCDLNIVEVETEKGFLLCGSCDSVLNNCINEPNEPRTEEDFYRELKGSKETK
jgi:hypothetical protein